MNLSATNRFASTKIEKLQTGLREFGLNPSDWILEPSGNGSYLILSTEEDGFAFYGKTSQPSPSLPSSLSWTSIQLLSI
jgi:hypothetical protein